MPGFTSSSESCADYRYRGLGAARGDGWSGLVRLTQTRPWDARRQVFRCEAQPAGLVAAFGRRRRPHDPPLQMSQLNQVAATQGSTDSGKDGLSLRQ